MMTLLKTDNCCSYVIIFLGYTLSTVVLSWVFSLFFCRAKSIRIDISYFIAIINIIIIIILIVYSYLSVAPDLCFKRKVFL